MSDYGGGGKVEEDGRKVDGSCPHLILVRGDEHDLKLIRVVELEGLIKLSKFGSETWRGE